MLFHPYAGILVLSLAGVPSPSGPLTIQLTVEAGQPIAVIMTQKLRFKLNEPVRARVTEPVFAFDREVISSGTEVTGRIVGFDRPSRWVRAYSLMGGNFTPLRQPKIEFDSVLLKDGTKLAIATDVGSGTENVVRFTDKQAAAKSRLQSAKDLARQQVEARKRAVIDAVKGPGKADKLKEKLWSMLPYHPQSLPAGARFTATLQGPLDFGTAQVQFSESDSDGSPSLSGDIVNALLTTPLDSKTAQRDMAVEARLSRPVFSADNHLIFPEGSKLVGIVVQAQAARHWHRSGKLAFMFTRIDAPPPSDTAGAPSQLPQQATQQVEGRLESVGVEDTAGNVRLDEEGGVSVQDSKKRFIAPAIAALFALRSTEGKDTEPDNDSDDAAFQAGRIPKSTGGNHFGPRILAGGIGFGLLGAALGRLSQPVASMLGFYGAGRLAYSNIIGRGQEITFPKNSPVEIRFSAEDKTP
jgi:hypothetical protein